MHGSENGLVLDRCADERGAPAPFQDPPPAEDREIVCLGSARREDDFVDTRANRARHALAGFVERHARLASPPVRGRRVAEARAEERTHRFENFVADRSGGRVIEVDGGRH
jgi:hypothetical protein